MQSALQVFALQGSLHGSRRHQEKAGGANRDRTDDLLLAKQALSQLSYGPIDGGSGWIRTTDLTLIRGAL